MDIISRNSMMSLFMGHMCPKSSSFCSGSSCSLSAQHLIQDNMRAHYQKVLSAKAAVDSSVPKTLLTSVKYKDQKKREKLFKALRQYQHILRTRRPLSALGGTSTKGSRNRPARDASLPRPLSPVRKNQQPPVGCQPSQAFGQRA
ncbi:spermatogenesis-associated protein 7-like [Erpetoichthys calabaricus]|uniref:spermatogenesis-associated protein 7-like n=1 Tax=Erpetoichthys calabaricus TaxID=27687 RepID=UPI002233E639|nr:spermatogenesis-associated protein 7-like [Erpetoichthys calabaricus]